MDSLPAEPPGKPKNTGVGSPSLLQVIFLTQESNQRLLHCRWILYQLSFQGSPFFTKVDGKESACSAGDPSSFLSWVDPLEIGYPLQYSWASLVAQTVKNPPAMGETWVQSLSWEDSLEEGMAAHSSILAWRIPMDRGAWRTTSAVIREELLHLLNTKDV